MKKLLAILVTFIIIILFLFSSTYPFDIQVDNLLKKNENTIPILVYHLVSDDIFLENTNLFIKPKEFENQIHWIVKSGYTPIFTEELSVDKNYKKPIIITFDDGYIDNYEIAFQIVKKYRIKITIFVITDMIDTKNHLTSSQISEMSDSGLVSIQSHTKSHSNLLKLNSKQLNMEFEESKEALFKLLDKYPTSIAYPFGRVNSKVIESVKKYYSLGFSTSNGDLFSGENKYMITRYGVGRATTLDDIKEYINKIDNNN